MPLGTLRAGDVLRCMMPAMVEKQTDTCLIGVVLGARVLSLTSGLRLRYSGENSSYPTSRSIKPSRMWKLCRSRH
jgi:hypothetical protein